MKINPYLFFDGQCEAALRLYEQSLGVNVIFSMTFAQSPTAEQLPPEWQSRIYHATFTLGDQTFNAADAQPGNYARPQGFSLMIQVDEPDEADRVYEKLAEHGTVLMPLQETHWARRFGVVTDQFGTPWMISCNAPA